MRYQRQGTCNRCGQCCGSMDSPNPANPFETWPHTIVNWLFVNFDRLFKLAAFVGLAEAADGTVEIVAEFGSIKIPSVGDFNWIWRPPDKGGLWTDLPPLGDADSAIPTCPFLLPDDGTGGGIPHRPCVFQDKPQYSEEWGLTCGWRLDPSEMSPEELDRWVGDDIMPNERSRDQWIADHPNCSFTWSEIIE